MDGDLSDEIVAAVSVGARVRHAVFGVGIVRQITPKTDDVEVVVDFGGKAGTKRLLASFARLEKC